MRGIDLAPDSMAVLPPVGSRGRRRPTGEHDPMHGEQLLCLGVLAELASQLQHVEHPVRSIAPTL